MSPPEIERLTADHEAALCRLEDSERKHKAAKRWIIGAVVTALATAGASVGKHYLDLREKRRELERVVGAAAQSGATSDHRWTELDKRLRELEDEIDDCDKRAAINATAIEFLSRDQRWIMGRAERTVEGSRPARASRPIDLSEIEAPPEAVQRKKTEILNALE